MQVPGSVSCSLVLLFSHQGPKGASGEPGLPGPTGIRGETGDRVSTAHLGPIPLGDGSLEGDGVPKAAAVMCVGCP